MNTLRCFLLAGAAGLAFAGHAAELRPQWVYGQLAAGEHDTYSATLGVAWPWDWRRAFAGGELTGQTEAHISHWSAHAIGGGRQSLTQLGLVPVLRLRFAEGRSDGSLRLRLINLGINPIKPGDVFVTSGAGGLFRPGTAVAIATRITRDGAIAQLLSNPAATDVVVVEPIWQPEAVRTLRAPPSTNAGALDR